jgi:hypothetical protein
VPRQLEFRQNANTISRLQKSGVQVGSETFSKERMLAIINGILEAKQNLRTLMGLIEASHTKHGSDPTNTP